MGNDDGTITVSELIQDLLDQPNTGGDEIITFRYPVLMLFLMYFGEYQYLLGIKGVDTSESLKMLERTFDAVYEQAQKESKCI